MRAASGEPEERWNRVADVVRRVGVSEHAVRTAIAGGHLAVVRPAGLRRGRWPVIRIPESALSAWLNATPAPGRRNE